METPTPPADEPPSSGNSRSEPDAADVLRNQLRTTSVEPARSEGPILAELAAAGHSVRSLTDLRHSGGRYPAAVPVLVRWLSLVDDPSIKEAIVRALSVPWAKPAATLPLMQQFREIRHAVDPSGLGLRWVVGNALEVLFDDASFERYVELAEDRSYGKARQMVVLALSKSKQPKAVQVLLGLVGDPDVDGHATSALARLKSPSARAALEAKLEDRRSWVRREARKGLTQLTG